MLLNQIRTNNQIYFSQIDNMVFLSFFFSFQWTISKKVQKLYVKLTSYEAISTYVGSYF